MVALLLGTVAVTRSIAGPQAASVVADPQVIGPTAEPAATIQALAWWLIASTGLILLVTMAATGWHAWRGKVTPELATVFGTATTGLLALLGCLRRLLSGPSPDNPPPPVAGMAS
jgi:hypothetical protein